MAKCDEGYPCKICHGDVESIVDSDLYLRYVLGLVDPETLHLAPDRHLRCNPALAQFIDDPRFPPLEHEGEGSLARLDPDFVAQRREQVTRAYRRLWEIHDQPGMSILDFPIVPYRAGPQES